jgi:hypothetical protein
MPTDAEKAATKPKITQKELRELGAKTEDGIHWVFEDGSRGRYTPYSAVFVAGD